LAEEALNSRHQLGADGIRRARLKDGGEVLIRPVQTEDQPLVAKAYARLSPDSRQRRFLAAPDRLTDEDLRYLTEIDHVRHEALAALDPETGEIVGEARYVRVPGDREAAEVAAVVIDDWQGRGVGTQLLLALTDRARENGVRRYTAVVSVDNQPVRDTLDRLGGAARRTGSEIEYAIELPSPGEPSLRLPERLQAALRSAASGQLGLLAAVLRRLPVSRGR
jgi:RimJ/RimL family protein N-acetyltransferase